MRNLPTLPHAVSTLPSALLPSLTQAISGLSLRSKQVLLHQMYASSNMLAERLTNNLVNPIIGRTGFTMNVPEDAPKTREIATRCWQFNKFDDPDTQRMYATDYFLSGELIWLRVWNTQAQATQLIPVPAPVVRQTWVDPGNYTEVIALEQEIGSQDTILHKVITDDRRLTDKALAIRQQCPFTCHLFQLRKQLYPTVSPYAMNDPLRYFEIRGTPLLMSSADLLDAAVKFLWDAFDKISAWNRFNFIFQIPVVGTPEQKQKTLQQWADGIGTPKPNSAVFLPDDIKVAPMNFTMQADDLMGVFGIFKQAMSIASTTRDTDLGEGNTRYASNQQPGVTEPEVEQREIYQGTLERIFLAPLQQEVREAVSVGTIPVSELDEHGNPRVSLTGNEISKRSAEVAVGTYKTFLDGFAILQQTGRVDEKSLFDLLATKTQELMRVSVQPAPVQPRQDIPNATN